MNTLTKLALGMIGHLKLEAPKGDALTNIVLPAPEMSGGTALMDALHQRQSGRDFTPTPLHPQVLSNLLWAACGINRPEAGGRTAPSAMNAQEVDLYLALPQGLYVYAPQQHVLRLVIAKDVRRVTGYQDFVDDAPLDLIYVADHARMVLVPASKRTAYASVAAGAMAQNVALYCAASGLASVVRAWFDRSAMAKAMGLGTDQQILLSQTLGYPKVNAPAKPATPVQGTL